MLLDILSISKAGCLLLNTVGFLNYASGLNTGAALHSSYLGGGGVMMGSRGRYVIYCHFSFFYVLDGLKATLELCHFFFPGPDYLII